LIAINPPSTRAPGPIDVRWPGPFKNRSFPYRQSGPEVPFSAQSVSPAALTPSRPRSPRGRIRVPLVSFSSVPGCSLSISMLQGGPAGVRAMDRDRRASIFFPGRVGGGPRGGTKRMFPMRRRQVNPSRRTAYGGAGAGTGSVQRLRVQAEGRQLRSWKLHVPVRPSPSFLGDSQAVLSRRAVA